MGVIHHRNKEIALYVPCKTGTTLLEKLTDFESYDFYIDHSDDREPRKNSIFLVRSHYDRLLALYYQKIVDPENDQSAWHDAGLTGPDQSVYGPEAAHVCFGAYMTNLGYFAWDEHVQPFLAVPYFAHAWWRMMYGAGRHTRQYHNVVIDTRGIDSVIQRLNNLLGLDPSHGWDEWNEMKLRLQKSGIRSPIKLTHDHPADPTDYGADHWDRVHYRELYNCYQDHGVLPSSIAMFDSGERIVRVANQVGYHCDRHQILDATGGLIDVCPTKFHLGEDQ